MPNQTPNFTASGNKRSFEYHDEEYNVRITVRKATVRDGIVRAFLIGKVAKELPEMADQVDLDTLTVYRELASRYAGHIGYPVCIPTLVSVENLGGAEISSDMSLDEFLSLPEDLVAPWEELVFELNSSWRVRERPTEGATPTAAETLGESKQPSVES